MTYVGCWLCQSFVRLVPAQQLKYIGDVVLQVVCDWGERFNLFDPEGLKVGMAMAWSPC